MGFVAVGKVGDIPEGSSRLFGMGTLSVVVFHLGENFFALEDLCPHRAGPLSEGKIEGTTVTCPWHSARFEVTNGKCLAGPAPRDARSFPVKVENGEIQVDPLLSKK